MRNCWRVERAAGVVAVLVLLVLKNSAWGQISPPRRSGRGGNFGAGISLGDPTGASLKLFLNSHLALQWHVAWLPAHHGSGGATMDVLWHPATLASGPALDLVPYIGGGFGFGLWSHDHPRREGDVRFGFMLRFVAGLALHWRPAPLDTVFEAGWTPYVIETNPADFGPGHGDISVKVRYYF